MKKPRFMRNREMHKKKGKPVSKEEFDKIWQDEVKKAEEQSKKKPLSLLITQMGRKQVYTLYHGKIPSNAFGAKKFVSQTYPVTFDSKKHTLRYTNNTDHVTCKVNDDNWGNIIAACQDLISYDWTQQNPHAKHILEVDTKRYIRMEILLKQLMDMLIARNQTKDQQNNKKHQKEEK